MITNKDLIAVFKMCALYAGFTEQWFDTLKQDHGLPYISHYIIRELWMKQLPENTYTKVMRKQLLFLDEKGHFNTELEI